MKTLVFCGRNVNVSRLRRDDGLAMACCGKAAERLERAGISFRRAWDYVDVDTLDERAMSWTKAWGRAPLVDGRSFRDLLSWKGVSLWWFAEIYLYHCTRVPNWVRLIETVERILEVEAPDEVQANGLSAEDEVLVGRVCQGRGVLDHCRRRPPRVRLAVRRWRIATASRWNTLKMLATVVKAVAGGRPRHAPSPNARPVLFVSHAAFWRTRRDPDPGEPATYEHYFDRLIPAVDATPGLRSFVIALGPGAAFRRRRRSDRLRDWLRPQGATRHYLHVNRYTRPAVAREVWRATGEIRRACRRLAASSGVRAAFTHKGVLLADLAAPDFAATLLLQLPWAVRSFEEMSAVLNDARPALACLYAESSGWGRATIASCRRAGVPTLALQHGILYPKYFSLRYDPDEGESPRPDLTAVYGESARRLLIEIGRYAPDSLVATGAPRFDDLVRTARNRDRAALRARVGVRPEEKLIVVASRYRALRDTFQAIGPVFAGFVEAVESLDGVTCLVKPHPAEAAEPYEADARAAGAARVRVLPPGTDLMELLHAADVLVTAESSSAIEALILGRPVVIVNMPTHLKELVEWGVALGVPAAESPRETLRAVLFDAATQARLTQARKRYVADLAMGADGAATDRIIDLVRAMARTPSVVV
jgi:hypothetical protein